MGRHTDILNKGKEKGYPFAGGICNGITLTWLTSIFNNSEKSFLKFINPISIGGDENNYKVLNTTAYYDSITLYQHPSEYYALFNKNLNQENIEEISLLLSDEKEETLKGFNTEILTANCYELDELKSILLKLLKDYESIPEYLEPLGVVLSSPTHVRGLSYSKITEEWKFFDINLEKVLIFKKNQLENLISTIALTFKHRPFLSLVINIIMSKRNSSKFRECITFVREKDTNLLKAKISNLPPESINELATIYSRISDVKMLKIVIEHINNSKLMSKQLVWSLWRVAILMGNFEIVKFLHNNFSSVTSEYRRSIISAAEKNNTQIVNFMIDSGFDVNYTIEQGLSPLLIASKRGNLKLAKALIKKGAHVNDSNIDGITPLFLAILFNNYDLVDLLIKKADLRICLYCDYKKFYSLMSNFDSNVVKRFQNWATEKRSTDNDLPDLLVISYTDIAWIMGNQRIINLISFCNKSFIFPSFFSYEIKQSEKNNLSALAYKK